MLITFDPIISSFSEDLLFLYHTKINRIMNRKKSEWMKAAQETKCDQFIESYKESIEIIYADDWANFNQGNVRIFASAKSVIDVYLCFLDGDLITA